MRIYLSDTRYFKIFFEKSPDLFFLPDYKTEKEICPMPHVSRSALCRLLVFLWRVLVVALVNALMIAMLLRAPL